MPEEVDEAGFQRWYKGWAKKTGINLNPDDPEHMYDYRAAYRAGDNPTWQPEHKQYRWPDRHKPGGYEQKYPHEGEY